MAWHGLTIPHRPLQQNCAPRAQVAKGSLRTTVSAWSSSYILCRRPSPAPGVVFTFQVEPHSRFGLQNEVLHACTTGCPAPPLGYTLFTDTDVMNGAHNDLSRMPHTTSAAAADICSATEGCGGFVLAPMGADDGNAGIVTLKTAVSPTISAPKRCLYELSMHRAVAIHYRRLQQGTRGCHACARTHRPCSYMCLLQLQGRATHHQFELKATSSPSVAIATPSCQASERTGKPRVFKLHARLVTPPAIRN